MASPRFEAQSNAVISFTSLTYTVEYGILAENVEQGQQLAQVYRLTPSGPKGYSLDERMSYFNTYFLLIAFPPIKAASECNLDDEESRSRCLVPIDAEMPSASSLLFHRRFPQFQNTPQGRALAKRKPDSAPNKYLESLPAPQHTPKPDSLPKLKQLAKLGRNITTNLRFDAAATLLSNHSDDGPIGRAISTVFVRMDSAAVTVGSNPTRARQSLMEAVNEFVILGRLLVGDQWHVKERVRSVGLVPTKHELENALKLLQTLDRHKVNEQTIEPEMPSYSYRPQATLEYRYKKGKASLIFFSCLQIWQLYIRCLASLDTKQVFELKDLLEVDIPVKQSNKVIKVLGQLARACLRLLERIETSVPAHFSVQMSELKARLAAHIVKMNLTIPEFKAVFHQIYEGLFARGLEALKDLEIVHESLMSAFNRFRNYSNSTSYYCNFLSERITKKIGLSTNMWTHLIDVATRLSKTEQLANLRNQVQSSNYYLSQLLDRARNSSGLSLVNAISCSRVALSEVVVKAVMAGEHKQLLGDALYRVVQNTQTWVGYTAQFIYFLQALNQASGNYRKFEGCGYRGLDYFLEKYLSLSSNEKLSSLRVKPVNYSAYLEMRDHIMYSFSKYNPAAFLAKLRFAFGKNGNTKEFRAPSVTENSNKSEIVAEMDEKKPEAVDPEPKKHYSEYLSSAPHPTQDFSHRFYLYTTIINEAYLTHILEGEEAVQSQKIVAMMLEQLPAAEDTLTVFEYKFIKGILTNFPDFPMLSLHSQMSQEDVMIRVSLVMWQVTWETYRKEPR